MAGWEITDALLTDSSDALGCLKVYFVRKSWFNLTQKLTTDSTLNPKASVFDILALRCPFSFGDVMISEKVGRKRRNTDRPLSATASSWMLWCRHVSVTGSDFLLLDFVSAIFSPSSLICGISVLAVVFGLVVLHLIWYLLNHDKPWWSPHFSYPPSPAQDFFISPALWFMFTCKTNDWMFTC